MDVRTYFRHSHSKCLLQLGCVCCFAFTFQSEKVRFLLNACNLGVNKRSVLAKQLNALPKFHS